MAVAAYFVLPAKSLNMHFRADEPLEFIIMSSPTQQSVHFSLLSQHIALGNRACPLITSGLEEPTGIALDRVRGFLFVSDRAAQKIYAYLLIVSVAASPPRLATDGTRVVVVTGRTVDWIAVDSQGDLLFSDESAESINKIRASVVLDLMTGNAEASMLNVISQSQLESNEFEMAVASTAASLPIDVEPEAVILSEYEAGTDPYVSKPSGVVADEVGLYWANQHDGKVHGTIVRGLTDPENALTANVLNTITANTSNTTNASGAPSHPSTIVTNASDTAFGIAKTKKGVFYTTNVTNDTGMVKGLALQGGTVYNVVNGLGVPGGLVWDGDSTIYVADKGGDAIYHFATDVLMDDAPISKVVEIGTPHGLAMLTSKDPAFQARSDASTEIANEWYGVNT